MLFHRHQWANGGIPLSHCPIAAVFSRPLCPFSLYEDISQRSHILALIDCDECNWFLCVSPLVRVDESRGASFVRGILRSVREGAKEIVPTKDIVRGGSWTQPCNDFRSTARVWGAMVQDAFWLYINDQVGDAIEHHRRRRSDVHIEAVRVEVCLMPQSGPLKREPASVPICWQEVHIGARTCEGDMDMAHGFMHSHLRAPKKAGRAAGYPVLRKGHE